jgi:beta-glucosidase
MGARRTRAALCGLLASALGAAASPAADLPQLGSSPTRDVVAAMTREEKVSLVVGAGRRRAGGQAPGGPATGMPPAGPAPVVGQTSLGVAGAAGTTVAIPRLGIPSIVLADGPAGLRIQPRREGESTRTFFCTAFPIETLLASTWDVDLVERVGRAMGDEVRDYGVDVLLGPALNTHRNPLGGRSFEYYSEDPLVSGRMAAAMVKGVQAEGVGTSVKHFVANDHEWNRNTIDVRVSQRALREIYLRGFELAVREGHPWTVMSSYNKVNGTYTSESAPLLTGVLRDDWGFAGLVMTDWGGGRDAVGQMKAGNDLLMPGNPRQQEALLAALQSGELKEEVLDRNVARILDVVTRTPSFRKLAHSDAPDLKAHAEVARQAAAAGMVLLRNEGGALPLRASAKLALFGNSAYATITGGTGSGDVNKAYSVALHAGLKDAGFAVDAALADAYTAYLAEQAKNQPARRPFAPPPLASERSVSADEIARLARDTDLGLVTIGRRSGEFLDRSREDFELSAAERQLLQDVAQAFHAQKKKLAVVLNVGGVIETASWRELADAILLAWQPGQEAGHAIADVLSGRTPPSGKLATSFPVRWEDVPSSANFPGKVLEGPDPNARSPFAGAKAAEVDYDDDIWVGYRHYATKGVKVAYPFGFGLSSTAFRYGELRLSSARFDKKLTASVSITNAGRVPGREVVQLYVSAPSRTMPKPALELRGFAKTKLLKPGESETVSFALDPRDLASFDERSSAWRAEPGRYTVKVGASSEDIRQAASFELPQDATVEAVHGAVR